MGSKQPPKRKPGTVSKPNRHGLNTMKKAMVELGNRAIDGRSAYGRAVYAFEKHYIDQLGGECAISQGERRMITMTARTALLLDTVDCYVAELGSKIINRRSKCLFPIVMQRQQLADSHQRQLVALGLERKSKPVPSLQAYIEANRANS